MDPLRTDGARVVRPAFSSAQRETEGRLAELQRSLRIEQERFAGIVEISADAIISIDEEQTILLFNQGAERIFGYAAGEVLGKSLDILLPPRFRASHRDHVEQFGGASERSRRMGHRREISGLRKCGAEFPAEASISQFRVGAARIFSVVLRDISERKRAEEHERLLARTGDMLVESLDYEFTVARAAELAIPTLGDACIVDLLEGDSLRSIAIMLSDRETRQLRDPVLERRRPLSGDTSLLAQALSRRSAHVAPEITDDLLGKDRVHMVVARRVKPRYALFVPLLAHDRSLGVLSLYASQHAYDAEDVALAQNFGWRVAMAIERGRLYVEAQRAINARDEMLAVVSHDLRNPVNAIGMIAGNLLKSTLSEIDGTVLTEYVRVIKQAAGQADALIQDLRDISGIEAGRLHVDPCAEDLGSVIDSATDLLGTLASEREIELRSEAMDTPITVYADSQRVHQVISNVVGNAIKFTPRSGRITIHAGRSGNEAIVSVSDTGPGIPTEQLPLLFDRYWQASRTMRGGAGLGLPIAKGIVEAHGGRIWVESTSGEGSTFCFSLPVYDAVSDAAADA